MLRKRGVRRGGRARGIAALVGLAVLACGRAGAAQVVTVASGDLRAEGEAVARLHDVPVRAARWSTDGTVAITVAIGGLQAEGTLEAGHSAVEARVDAPTRVDVGNGFETVVVAGARAPVVPPLGAPLRVALEGIGGRGLRGAGSGGERLVGTVLGPAVMRGRMGAVARNEERAGEPLWCSEMTVYARTAWGAASMRTDPYTTVHLVGRAGAWNELWLARGSLLVHAYTRSVAGCARPTRGGRGMSMSSSCSGPAQTAVLPRGLRLGATARSATPWLVVQRETQVEYGEENAGGERRRVYIARDGERGSMRFHGAIVGARVVYEGDGR